MTGLIKNMTTAAGRNLGTVSAYQIIDSTFDFANNITSIKSTDTMTGVSITSGGLGSFLPGSDVSDLTMVIGGTLNTLLFKGNLDDNSTITLNGPNAYLASMTVMGDMDGDLTVRGRVGVIVIKGNLSGDINIIGSNTSRLAMSSFTINGTMENEEFARRHRERRHDRASPAAWALPGGNDTFEVQGNLNSLTVGADKTKTGSVLALDLIVTAGNLGTPDRERRKSPARRDGRRAT